MVRFQSSSSNRAFTEVWPSVLLASRRFRHSNYVARLKLCVAQSSEKRLFRVWLGLSKSWRRNDAAAGLRLPGHRTSGTVRLCLAVVVRTHFWSEIGLCDAPRIADSWRVSWLGPAFVQPASFGCGFANPWHEVIKYSSCAVRVTSGWRITPRCSPVNRLSAAALIRGTAKMDGNGEAALHGHMVVVFRRRMASRCATKTGRTELDPR